MNSTSSRSKTCAVIPFYNESVHINKIIAQCLAYVDYVIAVNDGSTDNSETLVKQSKRVKLISYLPNRGKGYALNEGFKESLNNGYDITITIDADFQHLPDYIPSLVTELKNYDIVIGNRLSNFKNMPFHRIISNRLTSFLLSLKTKQKISDSQSGFRAYRTEIFNSVQTKFPGFEAESEIIVLAIKKNFRIGFTYVPTIYAGEKSRMQSLDTIIGFIKVLFM